MKIWITIFLSLMLLEGSCQRANQYKGTFLLSGTGSFDDTLALRTFVNLLPEKKNSTIIFIPTASSGIRLPNGFVFIPPKEDTTEGYIKNFEQQLASLFGVSQVKILHTRDKKVANSETFVKAIKEGNGVWLSSGNAGRLADSYLNTKTQQEIKNLIMRGGVVGGNSAGAIILGSYIVRGWTEKPMLMAKGHDKGFAFIVGVAINPHLITAKRENELISVIHEYPKLLGIGIDDYTMLLIKDNVFEVMGQSKVAIYDNLKHGDRWYFWVEPGTRFDLSTRKIIK